MHIKTCDDQHDKQCLKDAATCKTYLCSLSQGEAALQRAKALAKAMLGCQPTDQVSMTSSHTQYRQYSPHFKLIVRYKEPRQTHLALCCRHTMTGWQIVCLMSGCSWSNACL